MKINYENPDSFLVPMGTKAVKREPKMPRRQFLAEIKKYLKR